MGREKEGCGRLEGGRRKQGAGERRLREAGGG